MARYVRRRWPLNTLAHVETEWDLTTGEARGVLYAQASRSVINKIKKHRNGGWRVFLEVDALVIGETLQDFLQREQQRLADEERRAQQDRAALAQMASRLPACLGVAADGAAGVPSGRSGNGVQDRRELGDRNDQGALK